jgi:hypothetical protein
VLRNFTGVSDEEHELVAFFKCEITELAADSTWVRFKLELQRELRYQVREYQKLLGRGNAFSLEHANFRTLN